MTRPSSDDSSFFTNRVEAMTNIHLRFQKNAGRANPLVLHSSGKGVIGQGTIAGELQRSVIHRYNSLANDGRFRHRQRELDHELLDEPDPEENLSADDAHGIQQNSE